MIKNDYELIYLYQTTKDEHILNIIIEKYRPLIWKNIYRFYVEPKDRDDFYQEACLLMLDALEVFDLSRNKTFTKYYELILFRRFIHLKDKSPKYILYDKAELIESSYTPSFDAIDKLEEGFHLTAFEKDVFKLFFTDKMTQDNIAKTLDKDIKSIKNAIYRIKVKIQI
ncbi:RNA polymerase factor sigma-70 [Acholeplasma oculi]|uniref:RNA polymerase sigma factor SigS n=1 Tax=Acholeplasma oculi TaxID=35623 RepID=A0A061AK33_9MOLU|nr:sigma-70 family RNA polymerase sigma factor [Acholeplasma oculi]CDR31382.1 ECF subfamily RNA polymerase sigma-70 factor [Acholeplasma oculi]SKC39552.1 RNA polymerase sporulation-specific sigma factor [Acholeplasma oculi]SUT91839.1 RNA polymerase factor sigma-70 [Acholeplasma oculi]